MAEECGITDEIVQVIGMNSETSSECMPRQQLCQQVCLGRSFASPRGMPRQELGIARKYVGEGVIPQQEVCFAMSLAWGTSMPRQKAPCRALRRLGGP